MSERAFSLSLPVLNGIGEDDAEPPQPGLLNGTALQFPPQLINNEHLDESTPTASVAMSFRSRRFRDRFFADATDEEWADWKWQLRNRLKSFADLERVFDLSEDEAAAVRQLGDHLPVGITPYYASLCDPDDPSEGLRRTMIPVSNEFTLGPGESKDPLNEDGDSHVEGLVHRYPDRVLFLVTQFCATYCRYCTRARLVGQTGEYHLNTKQQ